MNVLAKSAWGSDDPTKAAFPFLHANAFAEAIVPVGWPPLREALARTVELEIPIHV